MATNLLFFEGPGSNGYNNAYLYNPLTQSTVDICFNVGLADDYNGLGNGSPVVSIDPSGTSAETGLVLFDGLHNGSSDLVMYDSATNEFWYFIFSTSGQGDQDVWGSGLDPQDFVATNGYHGDKLAYFVGDSWNGETTLWVSDGSFAGTHEVSGSPQDNGQMVAVGQNIYFNGTDSHGHNDLMEYSNGAFSILSTPGLNPQGMIQADIGSATRGGADCLIFDSGGNLTLYNLSHGGLDVWNGLNAQDFATVTYFDSADSSTQTGVAFNGEVHGKSSLYILSQASSSSPALTHEVAGTSGINLQDIVVLGSDVYFAGTDSHGGEGLWVYNASNPSSGAHEIVNSSDYNLDVRTQNNVTGNTISVVNGDVYFVADHGNTLDGVFGYNPNDNYIGPHIFNGAGAPTYNLGSVTV